MIERCGDRQRKCDGLKKWPLRFFIESLPVMLQVALLLLACGLCRNMLSVNTSVASTLIGLTGLGAAFFIGIVIAGTSSYACPFQTPASAVLRGPWKRVRCGVFSSGSYLKRVLPRIVRMSKQRVRSLLRRPSLPIDVPLGGIAISKLEPWLKPQDLANIRTTNGNDVRCVSWILRNITDPEALDAAVRLAGMIRWFDGPDVDVPYDLIVTTFEACFDFSGKLYPGSRDRAYYSGRAMVWIHALATHKSGELSPRFHLSRAKLERQGLDPDLRHLLRVSGDADFSYSWARGLLEMGPGHTPSHAQWIPDVLLHYSHVVLSVNPFWYTPWLFSSVHQTNVTTHVVLTRLLAWCAILDSPPTEEALMVQNKSYASSYFALLLLIAPFVRNFMEQILGQLSEAILRGAKGDWNQLGFISQIIPDLAKLEIRLACFTGFAYEWCSAIYENRKGFWHWEDLLFVCLELGFRHLDDRRRTVGIRLTHTEHHRALADVVFESQKAETIADLLHAWTLEGRFSGPADEMVGVCAEHLVGLDDLVPFSPRLRRHTIRFIRIAGYGAFEGAGVEKLIELLNRLCVTLEEMDRKGSWVSLLMDVIRSSEGPQRLSHWYWEHLVEFALLGRRLEFGDDAPKIAQLLVDAQEWEKLECWIGIEWMFLNPKKELEHPTLLLFRHRPGAAQKLEQWMERWSKRRKKDVPEPFRRILTQAHETVQRHDTL